MSVVRWKDKNNSRGRDSKLLIAASRRTGRRAGGPGRRGRDYELSTPLKLLADRTIRTDIGLLRCY